MTGFGRSSTEHGGRLYTFEVRSVNHRYCDVRLHVPHEFSQLGPPFEAAIRERFDRGRIDLRLEVAWTATGQPALEVDVARASALAQAIRDVAQAIGEPGTVSASWVAEQAGVLRSAQQTVDDKTLLAALRPALDLAIEELRTMRQREGVALSTELTAHLETLHRSAEQVGALVEPSVRARRDRLQERVNALIESTTLEPSRLEHEVAILAERSDITEELERLQSHFGQARTFLGAKGAIGRKFDFLIQEMNREVNTIGSKSGDSAIAHLVVEMKAEIERMREQVQNVE